MAREFEIRNSTAEFSAFIIEGKEDGIQVEYNDDTLYGLRAIGVPCY